MLDEYGNKIRKEGSGFNSVGRPVGARGKETLRAERLEQQEQRKQEEAEYERECRLDQPRFERDRKEKNLLYFGETAACENCMTIDSEVAQARIWSRLLGGPEPTPRQTKKGYIVNILKLWCNADCPLLDANTNTLSTELVDAPCKSTQTAIEKTYTWLDGASQPCGEIETEIQENL